MGSADVVPGVSGGTVAFLLGIYDELLEAIHASSAAGVKFATLRLRAGLQAVPWMFLLPLGAGILLAVFSLARLLDWLIANHPIWIWSFSSGWCWPPAWSSPGAWGPGSPATTPSPWLSPSVFSG